jgi:hypothetical protein
VILDLQVVQVHRVILDLLVVRVHRVYRGILVLVCTQGEICFTGSTGTLVF